VDFIGVFNGSRVSVGTEKYFWVVGKWLELEVGAALGFLDSEVRAKVPMGSACEFLGSVGRIILSFLLRLRQ
jgi:hypothetical protein